MTGEKLYVDSKSLKVGKYMLIEDIPCRIVNIETSRPGKHGHAKMRITGVGIFDGQKKQWLGAGGHDVEVPIITRSNAQVVSVSGNSAQLMDVKTYEIFELPIPEEMMSEAEAGAEAELLEAMGRKTIQRIKKA
ncbi:translation initiation factor IF-5A [Candidatus Micrarchaeota archaeon]|jgi:translation initiation factor 5A|nr:translation initiation factor IF-5A [Candidatus Micrarchaeota archaeon]